MKTRIITSIVALAIFAGVLLSPPIVFQIALCAVVFVMLHECYSSAKSSRLVRGVGFISSAAIMAAIYESIYYKMPIWDNSYFAAAIIFVVLLHMAAVVAEHGKSDHKEVLSSGFLTLYITISMSCIALAHAEFNIPMMLIIFICAWMTDTGAYFCGSALGKHKLIPHVSPKKTVEGAIGGIVISMLSCIIYLIIYLKIDGGAVGGQLSVIILGGALLGGIAAIFAQLGDLVASAIKRDTGVKDFGNIFPGHGGFMDRFDSVAFIAPVIYILLHFLIS